MDKERKIDGRKERKEEWVNEWMSEWVNEWMNEWMNEWKGCTGVEEIKEGDWV